MSQQPAPYPVSPGAFAPESNPLGLAGFVCSLVGLLVTGGLLCPIGLIISLVALGRQPRGLAVAGVILGLVGSCWLLAVVLLVVVFGVAVVAAVLGLGVAAFVLSEPEKLEVTADMANIASAIETYREENRFPPAELDDLDLEAAWRIDPWGHPYAYHLQDDPPGYELECAGQDGKWSTADDILLSKLDEVWAGRTFGVKVDEDDANGTVRIMLGDREVIKAAGRDDGGTVTINLGDRVLEITGNEKSGTVQVVPSGRATEPSGANAEPSTRPDD